MKLSTLMFTAAVVAAATVSAPVIADTGRHADKQHAGKAMHADRQGPLQQLLADIDLQPEQKSQIKQLMQQYRAEMRAAKTASREQMQTLMQADNFDEQQARLLLQQQQDNRLERQLSRIKLRHQILQILNDEQRQQVKTNAAKRWQNKAAARHSS